MMPSRGLQAVRRISPRTSHGQCRNLSYASRRPLPPAAPLTFAPTTAKSQQWRHSAPVIFLHAQPARHASTTPTSNTAAAAASSPATESTSFPNLDTITLDNLDLSASEIASIPEKIGYLKEIGLDYGWGPTSMLEFLFEHIHVYTGMPWWGSIATTAVILRLVMFPLYLKASDSIARAQALQSILKPISNQMNAARAARDQQGVALAYQQMMAIRKRAGLRFRDQFMPMIFQGVIGFCGFKLTRAMANLPVPGLKDGGFLWLQDLTLSDPYLILPVLMAGSIHLLVRMGGESGSTDMSQVGQGMRNFTLWGMPGLILITTGWLPGITCVWFAAGGGLAMGQSLLLQNTAVRNYFRLAPLYRPNANEKDGGPLASLMDSLNPSTNNAATQKTGGKSTPHMEPTWQAPNIRRASSSRSTQTSSGVIDTTLVKPSDVKTAGSSPNSNPDVNQSNAPSAAKSPGVLKKASAAWQNLKEQQKPSPEEMAKRERAAFKKAADAYEQKAQQRKKGRR